MRLSFAIVALAIVALPSQSPSNRSVLLLDRPTNLWFEGPWVQTSVSADGKSALVFAGLDDTHLFSLATGHEDPSTLRGDLDRVSAAAFCGSGLIRLGERGKESGVFFPGPHGSVLSHLPINVLPICSRDGSRVAFLNAGEDGVGLTVYPRAGRDRSVFIGAPGNFREYQLDGKIVSMAFSPDGTMSYQLVFGVNGESTLSRIDVGTGQAKVIASHLDASPLDGGMAIGPDGKRAYLALASDGPPNDRERQNPRAERWLKIYEIDLATGARKRVVESPGQDNSRPVVIDGNLYWTRTVLHDAIVAVPSSGGDVKEIIAGGEAPMWSPDGRRIAYWFGGFRMADWALNFDDAVVSVDENMRRTSEPSIIVAGNHEDFPPAWSPDGKWIAFHSHRSAKPVPEYFAVGSADDIWLRLANDIHAPEIRLTDFGWEAGPAYWSPDGQKLIFASFQRGGAPGVGKIFILAVDTDKGALISAEMLPLGPEVQSVNWSAWSPDGREIAIIVEMAISIPSGSIGKSISNFI